MSKRFFFITACLTIWVFAASSLLAGATQVTGQKTAEITEPAPAIEPTIIGDTKPYTLGREDVVDIIVRNQPEFSGRFVVGPDGMIQYYFVGDIPAEGLTREQLRQVLVEELEQFVKMPVVSVTIVAYNSKTIYILGEVFRPGRYPLRGDTISLREAIALAGLPTPNAALRRTYIFKSDTEEVDYQKVDLFRLLYRGRPEHNVELVSGDIVVVPSTIPTEINRALATLLAPFSQARAADVLIGHGWGAGNID